MTDNGADPELTSETETAIRKLLARARPSNRRLTDAPRLPVDRFRGALETATRRTVSRIIAVPGSAPFPRGEGMADEAYARLVRESISRSTTEALANGAGERFWGLCAARGRVADWMRVHDALWYAVRPRLAAWAYGSFAEGAAGRAFETLDHAVRLATGFALLADREGLDMIMPLVELLPLGVPVGRTTTDDTAWFVLAG